MSRLVKQASQMGDATMSPTTKILIGALITAIVAWFLWGPMGLGARCVATAPATEPVAAAPPLAVAPATPAAIANCQTDVDNQIKGKTIDFATGGSTITDASKPLLDALATSLKTCAGTSVEVAGYTDATGSDKINQPLSEHRAQAVAAALTTLGVPADRLTAKGYGSASPIDASGTPEGNAKNRRIEFHVAAASAAATAGDSAAANVQ
jgi:outer membrane protein OmpA-like peptidoglycan-associated protein